MKKYLSQLFIIIPLLLVAGFASAAYTYVGPTAGPGSANTEGPLDISANDQVKNGSLSVNAFQARGNALIDQESYYGGIIRGGTPADVNSTVYVGDNSTTTVLEHTGDMVIDGVYQSDTLREAGNHLRQLCGKYDGTVYVCN